MFENLFHVFPDNAAAITLSTTVWIGVCVAVLFNLRLGWNLSAMVVPGYLVPLLISRPATAGVIFIESLITYFIVRLLSDGFSHTRYWSSFFGRDRFFIIVLVSVIVRATFDGWLLPMAGQYVVDNFNWNFDYRNELQSFGLIVVALIANYFWKPGLRRGLFPIAVCVAVTWLLVSIVGIVTNLNPDNFYLMYEDISTSLLASPKSYIILITTAYLASWINLRYAWDFNGILIPALLGLTLLEPARIFATVAECILIYALGSALLLAPILRDVTMQGGRKLLFFFTVCYLTRFAFAHLIPAFLEQWEVLDAFGLGYLLSTLMAVKAHDQKIMVRMLKGTLQVSLVGGIAGSVIGFCLLSVGASLQELPAMAFQGQKQSVAVIERQESVAHLIRASKPLLYDKHESGSYRSPVYSDLTIFRSALNDLKQLEPGFSNDQLNSIAGKLARVNYSLTNVSGQFLFIKENAPTRGWGMYLIDPAQKDGICFEIPAPLLETATLESALALRRIFPTSAIAIAGARRTTNVDGAADVTQNPSTMFSVFHSVFGTKQTVQIRGMNSRIEALTTTQNEYENENENAPSQPAPHSCLFVQSAIPSALKLESLQTLIGEFSIQWNDSPFDNRVARSDAYAELAISRAARQSLMVASMTTPLQMQQMHQNRGRTNAAASDGAVKEQPAPMQESLATFAPRKSMQSFLLESKESILKMGSNAFIPATLEDMLFMDNEVVAPLIDLLGIIRHDNDYRFQSKQPPKWLTPAIASKLGSICSAASIQGYRISIVIDEMTGDQVVALHEDKASTTPAKGWGTFLFRPELMESYGVEIPRPLFENRSYDFGVSLFKRPGASLLMIAGAHPRANYDGTSDISRAANRRNLFNLVRQVLFRKFEHRPFLMCQARAIQAPVKHDIVIATDQGDFRFEQLSPLKQRLVEQLTSDRFSVGFVDGSRDTAGYELGIMMKAAAIQVSENKEIASLWLSPALRTKYRQQSTFDSLSAQMGACNIETNAGSLFEFTQRFSNPQSMRIKNQRPLNEALRSALNRYVDHFDVLQLAKLTRQHPELNFTHVVDSVSGQSFLLITDREQLIAIMNLTGFIDRGSNVTSRINRRKIDEFVASRRLWLEVRQP